MDLSKPLQATIIIFLLSGVVGIFAFSYKNIDDVDGGSITFSNIGEITVTENQVANIVFSFSETNKDVSIARNTVTQKTNKTFEQLGKFNIEDKDIQTTDYSVYPKYKYITINYKNRERSTEERRSERMLEGYKVTHETRIKIRNIDDISDILNIITNNDPENIGNVSFGLDEEAAERLKDDATVLAIKNTKSKAQKIAKESGINLGKIINISIGENYRTPQFRAQTFKENASISYEDSSSIPIYSGERKITITATITYEVK